MAVPEGEDRPKQDDQRNRKVYEPSDLRDDPEDGREDREDLSRSLNALETAVGVLKEQLALAKTPADRAEEDFVRSLDKTREAEARVREVEDDAAAFWSRSRWRRVRAAWRGRG